MAIQVIALANSDDVFLAWKSDRPLPRCLGFAIYRKRNGGTPELLKNRVGFKNAPDDEETQPSTTWPFQRVSWTDHGANTGDKVSYQIVAMIGTKDNLLPGPKSAWTVQLELSTSCGPGVEAVFNRGFVLSQFVSRIMRDNEWTTTDLRENVGVIDGSVRQFLAGDLRRRLLELLDAAASNLKVEVYAALFQLTDDELTERLVRLGKRLHIVLANGAIKKGQPDQNRVQRAKLSKAKCDVRDRMTAPSFLGHNKFLVTCHQGAPTAVWTGSANWMPTGLCTQLNNGVVISHPGLAQDYLDAWQRLVDAGDKKGKEFVSGNSETPNVWKLEQADSEATVFARFTAVSKKIDLLELKALIDGAKTSIYYAMFMPGKDLYEAVVKKVGAVYVRGVTNSFPTKGAKKQLSVEEDGAVIDESDVTVRLVEGKRRELSEKLRVIRPEGIENAFGAWAAEVTRKQFAGIGHSIIHSKCLVLDYGKPTVTVITGSHNFSISASKDNDENYLVVKGHQRLAEAFLINIFSAYDHYRWRLYVADCARRNVEPWQNLSEGPDWYERYARTPYRKEFLDQWF